MTFDDIEQIMEKLGFAYNYDKNMFGPNEPGIEFGQGTPLGEDWHEILAAESPEAFINDLRDYISDWDINEMARPYIEMMGKQGIPEDEEGLIEDAKWKVEQLEDLLNELQNIKPMEEDKEIKTEAFSEDLPDWLKQKLNKQILTKYKSRYSSEKEPVMNLAWDKIKYIPAEIPQNARANDLKDMNKLPVFRLNYTKYGRNYELVYIPGLLVPSIPGELVNKTSYDAPVNKVSYKQLLPYIKEFGYLDLTDSRTTDLRLSRNKAKEGSIERDRTKGQHQTRDYLGNGKYSDEIKWVTDRGYDKSGYPLDPDKQLKKLAKMSLENDQVAAKRIESIYKQLENTRTRVANILTNKDINALTGKSDIDKWDSKMYRIERAVRYLGEAVADYTSILKTLDDAKESDENWIDSWLAREFKSKIVEIKKDLDECNDCLKEFEK